MDIKWISSPYLTLCCTYNLNGKQFAKQLISKSPVVCVCVSCVLVVKGKGICVLSVWESAYSSALPHLLAVVSLVVLTYCTCTCFFINVFVQGLGGQNIIKDAET